MNKYELVGKTIEVFLTGGWTFVGLVEYASPEMLVLESEEGPLILYRDKIVAAKIVEEIIRKNFLDEVAEPEYDVPMPLPQIEENIQLNHYGAIIPEDMLEGKADPTPVSFTISMADFKDPKKSMEKKNSYGPHKKTRNNRKKNTE